jgi:hypothetical protein
MTYETKTSKSDKDTKIVPFDFFVYWETGLSEWISSKDVSIVQEKAQTS